MLKKITNRLKHLFQYPFYHIPKVLSEDKTLDYILKNKCSIARFGDGELLSLQGIKIEFQNESEDLVNKLKEIHTNENCLVCIPDFYNFKNVKKDEKYFWLKNKFFGKKIWANAFKNNKILGNANVSRFYYRKINSDGLDKYVEKLKKIWDKRNIIFIEGEKSRLGVGNDLFDNAKSIKRVLCPALNAFDKYYDIYDYIINNISKDDLIIAALGPTATVLSYSLSKVGYQCLDLGHIDVEYEWFKMKAKDKVAVKYKYVNEAADGTNPEDCAFEDYKSQILKTFI